MAPTLTSVVVARYEDGYLESCVLLPLVCPHYIDDILVIWPHTMEDFLNFFDGFNCVHPKFMFMMGISSISILFLELTVSKGFNLLRTGLLSTSLYFKNTKYLLIPTRRLLHS